MRRVADVNYPVAVNVRCNKSRVPESIQLRKVLLNHRNVHYVNVTVAVYITGKHIEFLSSRK